MRRSNFYAAPLSAVMALTIASACSSHDAKASSTRTHPLADSPLPCDPAFLPDVCASPAHKDPDYAQQVLRFWNDANMQSAETVFGSAPQPAPGGKLIPDADDAGYYPAAPDDPTGERNTYLDERAARITGILFYVEDGRPLHCSASVLRSRGKNLILTSAHCPGQKDGWRSNILFVPAYNGRVEKSQRTPLGRWPVEQTFLPDAEAYSAPGDRDVAVLRVYPIHDMGAGTDLTDGDLLEDLVGEGLVPRLNQPGESFEQLVTSHGYPGVNAADGRYDYLGKQWQCVSFAEGSTPDGDPGKLYTPNCSFTSGNSGGPLTIYSSEHDPLEVVSVVQFTARTVRLMPDTFCPIAKAAAGSVFPSCLETEQIHPGIAHPH